MQRITLLESVALGTALAAVASGACADGTYQALPFTQNWSNVGLITANDDWSGVPGIIGYLGDDLTAATGVDPQTVILFGTGTVDAIANQSSTTITSGGVAEFDGITDAVVALQGSGTADAPFILIHLDTTGESNITMSYNLRDIDGSADNAVQQVALQYRTSTRDDFTNIALGYVSDATSGPGTATLVTPVSLTLPAECENQPTLELRIITTNAAGSDEWVGIDDISVTAGGGVSYSCSVDDPDKPLLVGATATFDYTLTENPGAIPVEGVDVTLTVTSGPSTGYTDTVQTDVDGLASFSFTSNVPGTDEIEIVADTTPNPTVCLSSVTWNEAATREEVLINELDADTPGTDTLEFIELYDGGVGNTPLDGLVVVFWNGSNDTSYAAFDLDGKETNGDGYFILGNTGFFPLPMGDGPFAAENILIFPDNTLQNGQDAVALYTGDASSFPNGTAVTTTGLRDAVVYGTNDPDDAGLAVLLNENEPQINEDGGGDSALHSIQRCPNGSGGLRNTSTFAATAPTWFYANAYSNAPANVSASPDAVCEGGSTSLSADIGPDETLDWYEGSLAGPLVGSGNPLEVLPEGETTYFAVLRHVTSGCIGGNGSVAVTTARSPTWYADLDGDGAGDPDDSFVSCLPPKGYVANADDQCPDDGLKTEPGTCGCGTPDDDTDGDGVADCIDECEGYPDGDDCNANGIPDACEVLDFGAPDVNNNLVPDICECPADLNDDGEVGGADLTFVLGNWGLPGVGDINNDGTTNGADIAILLAAWGGCPTLR